MTVAAVLPIIGLPIIGLPVIGCPAAIAAAGGGEGLGALLDFAPGAMLWTWIAFLVALPVMWKMVYGPITKALDERDSKVEDAIRDAEKSRQEAAQQMAAAQQELDKARAEGRRMVEAARKYNKVVQIGTQRRSSNSVASARDYVQSGKLGKVAFARTWIAGKRPNIGKAKVEPVPQAARPSTPATQTATTTTRPGARGRSISGPGRDSRAGAGTRRARAPAGAARCRRSPARCRPPRR